MFVEAEPKCSINSSRNNTVEGDGVRLTCEVTYNGTENVSMLWKDVEDAPPALKRGKTTIRSYSVGSSAPEVPSFTCITSIQVMTAAVAATNTPSITCKTPSVEIICKYYNTCMPTLDSIAFVILFLTDCCYTEGNVFCPHSHIYIIERHCSSELLILCSLGQTFSNSCPLLSRVESLLRSASIGLPIKNAWF